MFLQPSKVEENWLRHAQVIAKMCKKKKIKKKNTKNIKRTLKARISAMAWQIRWKFGMECVLFQGTFHSKNGAVSFRRYRVTDA